ncbi:hypothetical protein HYS91_03345 [Candidatus Daviesbacteria bacterium]|nr:hypothetical protein [Candidatus Daviesbacteria bacterium]
MLQANFRIRIRANKPTLINRALPGKGELMVTKGEEVKPQDTLGKYEVSGGFSLIHLAKEIGATASLANKFLQRKIGERIFKGELLAFKKGFFRKKILTSPTDGVLENYNPKTGDLLIRLLPKQQFLTSGVYGIVEDVDSSTNKAVIKSLVTEVFGVIGSGKERSGLLHVLQGRGNLFTKQQVSTLLRGSIIVGGALLYSDTLKKCIQHGVGGIIIGGVNSKDLLSLGRSLYWNERIGTDLGISVIATEGFGAIPIGDDIYNLLQTYNQKYVFINGNIAAMQLPSLDSDSIMYLRKVSLPKTNIPSHQPDLERKDMEIGDRVRIIWPPFMGALGEIIGIDKSLTKLESGISTFLVTIELASRKIKVPFPNLELI